MAGVFDEWDGVKKVGVVFKKMDGSEGVIVMTERQGQIWKKIRGLKLKRPSD